MEDWRERGWGKEATLEAVKLVQVRQEGGPD